VCGTVEGEQAGASDERAQRANNGHSRAARSWRSHGLRHRGVPRPPQPAVHRRLPDARLGRRRGGRPAGDLGAVGRRRPRRRTGSAGVPGPDHHPPGARPAANAPPPQRVLRRPLVARAAADRARCGRGRRVGRQRLDGDAAGAGDAHADRAGGVRAARGVRSGVRRGRRSRRQEPGRGPARSPTGHEHTSPQADHAGSFLPPRPEPRSRRSSGRSKRAICSTCSTFSRRTSSP
jgi:hypothetical protein